MHWINVANAVDGDGDGDNIDEEEDDDGTGLCTYSKAYLLKQIFRGIETFRDALQYLKKVKTL